MKPELVATAPNQVWSWDITKLAGPAQVGLVPALRDPRHLLPLRRGLDRRRHARSAALAEALIADAIYRQQASTDGQLTLHADRGSSMTSKTVSPAPRRSRRRPQPQPAPRQSNDNPYSEAQFKTLKYSPRRSPRRFGSIIETPARSATAFFEHYNHHHRHSGIGLHTPADVHYGTRRPRSAPNAKPSSTPPTPHRPRPLPPTTLRPTHP